MSTAIDLHTLAMLTRHRAVAYLHAALDVQPRGGALKPKYFMFSHSIELGLKAFLMAHGHSVVECRKLGHDLTKAMQLAQSHNLGLSTLQETVVHSLSAQHDRTFSFRYFNPDGWSAPNFLNFERTCCRGLLNGQVRIFAINGLTLRAEHKALER